MSPSELSEKLWDCVDRVAPYLLPNGRKESGEWVAGSVDGDAGKSLKVNLAGKRKWTDFATGEGGDLLDLWMAAKGCNLHQAMNEAKSFLGIRDSDHHFAARQQKKFSRPDRQKIARHIVKDSQHHIEYLASRGLTEETVRKFQVTAAKVWDNDTQRELPALAFPYKRDGELLQVKRISTERPNGKKILMAEKDCEPCLFGWELMPADSRAVVICEGEIDCMTFYQYGFPALSVPFGGGKGAKQQWIDFEYHNLDRFEEIYLALDSDKTGQEAAREIARRLGDYRCQMVTLPFKDANECLMQGVTTEAMEQAVLAATSFDPDELSSASEFKADTWDAFYGAEQYLFETPWHELNQNFRFREAELTVLSGVNGHGKSQILGHVVADAMRQGVRACIGSFELLPKILLKRLTRQITCLPKPPQYEFEEAFRFYSDRLWLFNLVGMAKLDRMLEIFEYASRRYGVKLFIVDSLTKLDIDNDDYNGQKNALDKLCDFKNRTGSHVILVTHARKGENEERPTGKMDVKGSGAITDLCDNLMIIWRNKLRESAEKKLQAGIELTSSEQKAIELPASLLKLEKQRNGEGWEGSIGLFLEPVSTQFLSGEKAAPFNYLANMPNDEYMLQWASENVTEYA